jgi:hypothetical protein
MYVLENMSNKIVLDYNLKINAHKPMLYKEILEKANDEE